MGDRRDNSWAGWTRWQVLNGHIPDSCRDAVARTRNTFVVLVSSSAKQQSEGK